MARSRFVQPDTVRLDLSDGDWIEVKRELTYGEQQELAALVTRQQGDLVSGAGVSVSFDLGACNIERAAMWIVSWSFRDMDGNPVEVSRETIRALTVETGTEIDRILTQYIASLEAQKN